MASTNSSTPCDGIPPYPAYQTQDAPKFGQHMNAFGPLAKWNGHTSWMAKLLDSLRQDFDNVTEAQYKEVINHFAAYGEQVQFAGCALYRALRATLGQPLPAAEKGKGPRVDSTQPPPPPFNKIR